MWVKHFSVYLLFFALMRQIEEHLEKLYAVFCGKRLCNKTAIVLKGF